MDILLLYSLALVPSLLESLWSANRFMYLLAVRPRDVIFSIKLTRGLFEVLLGCPGMRYRLIRRRSSLSALSRICHGSELGDVL